MKRRLSMFGSFAVVLACAAMCGCYRKVNEHGNIVISFDTWVPVLAALIGLAAVPVGGVMFARGNRFKGGLVAVIGPLAAVVIAPMFYLDRVVINEEGFSSRHGFWWSPTVHDIRYQDLAFVQVTEEVRTTRRGRSYSYYFDCTFKSGRQERVPLGDVMKEALPEIAEHFRRHGVVVIIPPDLKG
jgi:hypothetical protein